jgi:hypothetical protein
MQIDYGAIDRLLHAMFWLAVLCTILFRLSEWIMFRLLALDPNAWRKISPSLVELSYLIILLLSLSSFMIMVRGQGLVEAQAWISLAVWSFLIIRLFGNRR